MVIRVRRRKLNFNDAQRNLFSSAYILYDNHEQSLCVIPHDDDISANIIEPLTHVGIFCTEGHDTIINAGHTKASGRGEQKIFLFCEINEDNTWKDEQAPWSDWERNTEWEGEPNGAKVKT